MAKPSTNCYEPLSTRPDSARAFVTLAKDLVTSKAGMLASAYIGFSLAISFLTRSFPALRRLPVFDRVMTCLCPSSLGGLGLGSLMNLLGVPAKDDAVDFLACCHSAETAFWEDGNKRKAAAITRFLNNTMDSISNVKGPDRIEDFQSLGLGNRNPVNLVNEYNMKAAADSATSPMWTSALEWATLQRQNLSPELKKINKRQQHIENPM